MTVFLSLLIVVLGTGVFWFWRKRRHRQDLLAMGLEDWERDIILDQVPLLSKLPADLQSNLEGKINLFLDQVTFYGCDDLEITDEIQLSIAAQACLLVVNKEAWYETLQTVLVYPSAFKSKTNEHHGYLVTEREIVRLGESWARGPVILSWRHSDAGARDPEDGQNVVIHEFAHQLDGLSGNTNGLPVLSGGQKGADWAHAIEAGYNRLVKQVNRRQRSLIDPYGATSITEFFAVLVELFFERPKDLLTEEPEIYEQLVKFFNVDTAKWGA
jgi:Mlc titration factor MtfA (ptsG expression regulator)